MHVWRGHLGIIHSHRNEFEKAEKYFTEALENAETPMGRITWYGNLGNLYKEQGKLVSCIDHNVEGESVAEDDATSSNEKASSSKIKAFESAEEYFQEALKLTEELKDVDERNHQKATWLTNIGNLCLDQGENQLADQKYKEARNLIEKSSHNNHRKNSLHVNLLGNKGTLLRCKGHYKKALQNYDEAICKSGNNGDNKYSQSVWKGHKGITLHEQGDFFNAINTYKEALKLSSERKNEGILTGYMGDLYRKLGKMEMAESCYDKAYNIAMEVNDVHFKDHWFGCKDIVDLDRGRFDQAEAKFQVALRTAKSIGSLKRGVAQWTGYLGNKNMDLGQYKDAAICGLAVLLMHW